MIVVTAQGADKFNSQQARKRWKHSSGKRAERFKAFIQMSPNLKQDWIGLFETNSFQR